MRRLKKVLSTHGEIDTDNARHPRLLHGDAVELISQLHGALVVGDENKLCGARHRTDEIIIAINIGVIEGRVNFVQQTKRWPKCLIWRRVANVRHQRRWATEHNCHADRRPWTAQLRLKPQYGCASV